MRGLTCVLWIGWAATGIAAQDRTGGAGYRQFQLESRVETVATQAAVPYTDVRTVHRRPAVMQELTWKLPLPPTPSATGAEPLQKVVFSFYDDQLFRIRADYDPARSAGLTDEDLIEALSTRYGLPAKGPAVKVLRASADEQWGIPIVWWSNPEAVVVLYRSAYTRDVRVVVTSIRLDYLARTAEARAVLLDTLDGKED